MKNKLNKFITGSMLAILLASGIAGAQTATPTPVVNQSSEYSVSSWNGYGNDGGMMDTGNWQSMHGEKYSKEGGMWRDLMPAFAAGFIGLGIVFSVVAILLFAFWIWMLVHAAKSDIKHKPMWLLVIWFMHIIGAVIYFFVIKRRYDAEMMECGCEDCACDDMENTCACGKNETCQCEEVAGEEHTH